MVAVDAEGGVVAIPHNTDSWPTYYRKSAEELMSQKCPGGYVIDQEGEVAVGQQVTQQRLANDAGQTTVTRTLKEWQIHFHAKEGPPRQRRAHLPEEPVPAPRQPRSSLPTEPEPVAQ
jgi:hypothetical protein